MIYLNKEPVGSNSVFRKIMNKIEICRGMHARQEEKEVTIEYHRLLLIKGEEDMC